MACSAAAIVADAACLLDLPGLMTWKQDQPEPAAVATAVRVVAAAVRRPAEPGAVAPAAAAHQPVGAR